MSVLATCTACDSKFRFPDKVANKQVRCPKCGNVIAVPGDDSSNPETAIATAPVQREQFPRDSSSKRSRPRRTEHDDLDPSTGDPDSRAYVHELCGAVTRIAGESYTDSLANPLSRAGVTWCGHCRDYYLLEEFYWEDNQENILEYRDRLRRKLSGLEAWLGGVSGAFFLMILGPVLGIVLGMLLGLLLPTLVSWILGVILCLAGFVGGVHLGSLFSKHASRKMHAEDRAEPEPAGSTFALGATLTGSAMFLILIGLIVCFANYFSSDKSPQLAKRRERPEIPNRPAPRFPNRNNPPINPGGNRPGRLPPVQRDPNAAINDPGLNVGGIRAMWTFDEGKGDTATDASKKKIEAGIHGCRWVPGVKGTALEFDGQSSYVDLGADPILSFAEKAPFTVTGWMKTTQDSKGMLLSFRNSEDVRTNDMIMVFVEGGFLIAWVRHRGFLFAPDAAQSAMRVNDGQWHHFAVTRDDEGEVHLIVDGVNKTKRVEGRMGRPYRQVVTDLRCLGVNALYLNNRFRRSLYEGCLDEIGIYGRVLTDKEIRALATK